MIIIPDRKLEDAARLGTVQIIAGVDEVGRGCLAGPVVSAAVVLPAEISIPLLRDSKKLSPKQRIITAHKIKQQALAIGVGWASAQEVDELGLTQALMTSAVRAIKSLQLLPQLVILDGNHNYLQTTEFPAQAHIAADATEACVAAASVVAKVARDAYMSLMATQYPVYGFEKHVGYGTAYHRQQIQEFGASPLHRRSFAGVL